MHDSKPHGAQNEDSVREPGESSETSWFRRHLVKIIIGILLALVAYFGDRTLDNIESRLETVEKNTSNVDQSFKGFKKDAETTHTNLKAAIEVASEKFDEETEKIIKRFLSLQTEQKKLRSSLGTAVEGIHKAGLALASIRTEIENAATRKQLETLEGRVVSAHGQLTSVESKLQNLSSRAESAKRERILIEAKRRLSLFDEEYLYSKIHPTKKLRAFAGSGFVGQQIPITPTEPEYQVSRTVSVDFQDGTLRLWGKVKNPATRVALMKRLEDIPGVERIDDERLEVEGL